MRYRLYPSDSPVNQSSHRVLTSQRLLYPQFSAAAYYKMDNTQAQTLYIRSTAAIMCIKAAPTTGHGRQISTAAIGNTNFQKNKYPPDIAPKVVRNPSRPLRNGNRKRSVQVPECSCLMTSLPKIIAAWDLLGLLLSYWCEHSRNACRQGPRHRRRTEARKRSDLRIAIWTICSLSASVIPLPPSSSTSVLQPRAACHPTSPPSLHLLLSGITAPTGDIFVRSQ